MPSSRVASLRSGLTRTEALQFFGLQEGDSDARMREAFKVGRGLQAMCGIVSCMHLLMGRSLPRLMHRRFLYACFCSVIVRPC
jgi:hypothetical protein